MKYLDSVEEEYERALRSPNRDDDKKLELSIGLRQYREMFKARPTWDE